MNNGLNNRPLALLLTFPMLLLGIAAGAQDAPVQPPIAQSSPGDQTTPNTKTTSDQPQAAPATPAPESQGTDSQPPESRVEATASLRAGRRAIQEHTAAGAEQMIAPLLKAARTFHQIGDQARELNCLQMLGIAYAMSARHDKALEYDQQALALARQLGKKLAVAKLLNAIGTNYGNSGQPGKATEYYQQALTLGESLANQEIQVGSLNNLARASMKLGQSQKAADYLSQAVALQQKGGATPVGRAVVLESLGQSYMQARQPAKGLQYLQQALEFARQAQDETVESTCLLSSGMALRRLNQPRKALDSVQQAIVLLQKRGAEGAEARALTTAASLLTRLGRRDEAQADYEQAIKLANDLVDNITDEDLKRTTFQSIQGIYQWYVAFLLNESPTMKEQMQNATVGADVLWRALEVSEMARSRALRDLLANNTSDLPSAAVAQPGPDDDDPPADSSASSVVSASSSGAAGPAAGGTSSTRATPLPAAAAAPAAPSSITRGGTISEDEDAALAGVAEALPPLSAAAPAAPFSRTEVAAAAADGPVLFYQPMPRVMAIFVVTSAGDIHLGRSLVTPAELQRMVESAREVITSRVDPSLIKYRMRALYNVLIAPVEPWLPRDEKPHMLTLIPAGSLFQTPFGALVGPQGGYLIQRYALRTSPSLTVLHYTREHEAALKGIPETAVLFGDPTMPAGWADLPGASAEVQRVGAVLSGQDLHPMVSIHAAASEAAFRLEAPRATEIHLATHGYMNESQPLLSGVILAPSSGSGPAYERDGYLTVAEVFRMKLNARLVTLSACDSGLGPASADGVFGLQSAFLAAGSASLLSSLWEVDDAATSALMTQFYRRLEADPLHDRARALQGAEIAMLSTDAFKSPVFWAAFELTGEAR